MNDRTRPHPGKPRSDEAVATLFGQLDDLHDDRPPEDLALARFAERARLQRIPWPIVPDQFSVLRATPRRGGHVVWSFEHAVSGGHLHLDERGRSYRFVPTPNGRGVGRFNECDARKAIFEARLHHVLRPAVEILRRKHLALVHSA